MIIPVLPLFDMVHPTALWPRLTFLYILVGGQTFNVKYSFPPKTIKDVLKTIKKRTGIRGGILDSNGSQMDDADLFLPQTNDPDNPYYKFQPAPPPNPQQGE
jgi:hypothetical protein